MSRAQIGMALVLSFVSACGGGFNSLPQSERDQFNRLLARAPRLRVEGEVVRDIALSASGLLNPKLGGPSVFSPAPAFLFLPPASYGPFVWNEAVGPDGCSTRHRL